MYKGFDLVLNDTDFLSVSNEDIKKYKNETIKKARSNLSKTIISSIDLKNKNGVIDATKLKNTWFPTINCQIFLSHSHSDVEMAIRLACWLKKEFNLETFVDSIVWEYSDDLIKQIDDIYCLTNKEGVYDYGKRNYSTSQVHLLLSTSLANMIDCCECLFFLNTKNSIEVKETIEHKTNSPWIYAELQTARLIFKKAPDRLVSKSYKVLYEVNKELRELTSINEKDLIAWKDKYISKKGSAALDELYNLKKNTSNTAY